MAKHNRRERDLLADLNEKNRLGAEFRRLTSDSRRWRDRLRRRGSKRWQAQYRQAIARAEARLDELRDELLRRAADLRGRIQEEQKISKTEVAKFEKKYDKELEELRQARKEMAAAEEALSEAEAEAKPDSKEAAELLEGLRRKLGRAARKARREGKDVQEVREEIDSEERDHELLTAELQRTIAEIASLRR